MHNFRNQDEHWGRTQRFSREGWGRHGERGPEERGEHPERGGRGWHHGGGRGHARPFDHGALRLLILAMVAEKPRHGYEIIKEIEGNLGGSYSPSPGVVYPTLTLIEEMGHATVAESGGRKLYTITPEGEAYLAAHADQVAAIRARMQGRSGGRRGVPPQLIRAMENLKLALRLRMRAGNLDEEQIQRIVAALDAAAVAIENE